MQLQGEAQSGGGKVYRGSFDCIFKTLQSEGLAGTQVMYIFRGGAREGGRDKEGERGWAGRGKAWSDPPNLPPRPPPH